MNQKAAYAFRILLSGYLAYLGVKILLEMAKERPSNMIFMMVAGAVFLVIGAGYAVYCIKKVWDIKKAEKEPQTDETGTEENYSTNLSEKVEHTETKKPVSEEKRHEPEMQEIKKAEPEKTETDTEKPDDSEVKEDLENDYEEK